MDLTLTGALLGTPSYISPEAAAGQAKQLTTAADVYSLGAILYELLTGRPPFTGDTTMEVLRKVVEQEPVRPSAVRSSRRESAHSSKSQIANRKSQIPPDLETICLKCLEKDPQRRYNSAAGLADDLERWQRHEPIVARLSSPAERLNKWIKRNPVRAGGIAAFLLVLLAGIAGITWQWRRASAQAEESRQRLVRLNVATGVRSVTEGDPTSALPWFVEALRLDHQDPTRNEAHRTRIAAALRQSPRLVQIWSHEAEVTYAEFSPDGGRVVAASQDKTARVWDALTGRPLTPPLPHDARVWRAVFSPDGQAIATACSDSKARVWNALTGEPVTPFLLHDDRHTEEFDPSALSFSPDGKKLVTAVYASTANVWKLPSGVEAVPPLRHPDVSVTAACFSPDGSRVLTAAGHEARLWDAATGQLTGINFNLGQDIYHAAFNRDGTRVVTAGDNGLAQAWDAATGKPVGSPLHHSTRIPHAEFSPDGARMVTASLDATARVWDAVTGQPVTPPLQHSDAVKWAAFSPDDRWVVTACDDHSARVWSAATGALLFPPLWHGNRVTLAVFSPKDGRVLTASADGTARLWELAGTPQPRVLAGTGKLRHAWFDRDRRRIITLGEDKVVQVWDAANGNALSPPLRHSDRCNCAALSPDAARLATGSKDSLARVWDVASGKVVSVFKHERWVRSVAWRPDGHAVASATDFLSKIL